MCKMLAREIKVIRRKPEWEIEVVVAEKGNKAILDILRDMKISMAQKASMPFYTDKPCRFIYRTTGPVRVGKTLEEKGYQPQVTVFSMCRPVQDLEKLISLDNTGRVICGRSGMESYDVLSAFSMSYNTGNMQAPPPLATPSPPPRPPPPTGGQRKKFRFRGKRPEFQDAEVPDTEAAHAPSTALVQHEATQPCKDIDEVMRPGYEPHEDEGWAFSIPQDTGYQPHEDEGWALALPSELVPHERHQKRQLTQEEREVFDDILTLFLDQRKCVSVEVAYTLLRDESRAYIRSVRNQRGYQPRSL